MVRMPQPCWTLRIRVDGKRGRGRDQVIVAIAVIMVSGGGGGDERGNTMRWEPMGESRTAEQDTKRIARKSQHINLSHGRLLHRTDDDSTTHHQRPSHITPQSPRAEQQTPRSRDLVQIELGQDAPAHQFEVEVDCLVGEAVGFSGIVWMGWQGGRVRGDKETSARIQIQRWTDGRISTNNT